MLPHLPAELHSSSTSNPRSIGILGTLLTPTCDNHLALALLTAAAVEEYTAGLVDLAARPVMPAPRVEPHIEQFPLVLECLAVPAKVVQALSPAFYTQSQG